MKIISLINGYVRESMARDMRISHYFYTGSVVQICFVLTCVATQTILGCLTTDASIHRAKSASMFMICCPAPG